MSLYSALNAGVSGLSAQASAMATVADNITNINTVGYKGTTAQFSTLVTDGRASASYSAGGVSAVPHAMISKQGALEAASGSSDMGIAGVGFFVTRSGLGADSQVSLTRAGSFTPDAEGYLKNAGGYYLQGWKLDGTGNYVNSGSLDSLEPIRVSSLAGTAMPTTKIELRANLMSTTPTYAGTPAYTVGSMASGAVAPAFSQPVTIVDAQGGSHDVTMAFIKTGPNAWASEIYATPASDVTAPGGVLASGNVMFNPDGSLDLAGSTPALFASITPTYTNGAGSVPIKLGLGTDGGLDGLSQFNGKSEKISATVDGSLLGKVASIDVSESGVVSAVFDSGKSRAVFQLPLATVQNADGMTRLSGNAFAASDASGSINIAAPGASGGGTIEFGKLEASTVDLALEFTNMIRFQRAYSASSKIITTVDEMLQEVSNLKR